MEHWSQRPAPVTLSRRRVLGMVPAVLCQACQREDSSNAPSIAFTRIPQADPAGSARNDIIEGHVTGASPGQKIVLYARTGKWWVQPLVDQPMTDLRPDLSWTNATHLGTHYAALLVNDGYRPQTVVDLLPETGNDILAVAVVSGADRPPSTIMDFSGYQWRLRDAPSSRGGRMSTTRQVSQSTVKAQCTCTSPDGQRLELPGGQPDAKFRLQHLPLFRTGTRHAGACRRLRNVHL